MSKPKMSKLELARAVIDRQLGEFAEAIGPNAPVGVLAEALVLLRGVKKAIDDGNKGGLEPSLKPRIIAAVKAQAQLEPDRKGLVLEVGGWRLPIKPYRSGLDPRKVEALLRAKKKDPAKWMTEVPTYKLLAGDEAKLDQVLSDAELKACEYEESWTVETPERI